MISLLILLGAAGAPSTDCQSPPPLPAELAPWSSPSPDTNGGQLAVGAPIVVPLEASPSVEWTHPPGRAPAEGSRGAVLTLTAAEAGMYRIALSDAAWIDVVGPPGLIPSTTHGHGPECSEIRKIVDFALQPGRHLLQISGATTPSIRIMVTRR